jgi:hypothetical protein
VERFRDNIGECRSAALWLCGLLIYCIYSAETISPWIFALLVVLLFADAWAYIRFAKILKQMPEALRPGQSIVINRVSDDWIVETLKITDVKEKVVIVNNTHMYLRDDVERLEWSLVLSAWKGAMLTPIATAKGSGEYMSGFFPKRKTTLRVVD